MRKGEITKRDVLRLVAAVFNRQGFAGTSLADLMSASGLRKGGLYHHFVSKEDLAAQAFDHSVQVMRDFWMEALAGEGTAAGQLHAIVAKFDQVAAGRPLPGGCPLMNAALDGDDAYPWLRARARAAFDDWRGLIAGVVRRGAASGEFRADADPEAVAVLVIAALEGALALTRLGDEVKPLQVAADHLHEFIDVTLRASR